MPETEDRYYSEPVQEIMGTIPSWVTRWGVTVIAGIFVLIVIGCCIIKYPQTVTSSYPFFRQYADNASSYVSVSLNIPILSGLSARNGVRRSKTALKDAEYALAGIRKGIVKEYKQAEIDARTAYEKFLMAQRQVRAAEEAAKQIAAKYDSGAADILTYSTAVSELASARYQLLSAKYEYVFKWKILMMLNYIFSPRK